MSDSASYGDTWAPIYDEVHTHHDPTATVDVLARLAGTGKALELGIGTGRVAIPLAARGVAVAGIEASQAMLDRMRAKPGGAAIPVTLGDFTEVAVEGEYAVKISARRSTTSSRLASTCCSRVTIRCSNASRANAWSWARRACSCFPPRFATCGRASST